MPVVSSHIWREVDRVGEPKALMPDECNARTPERAFSANCSLREMNMGLR